MAHDDAQSDIGSALRPSGKRSEKLRKVWLKAFRRVNREPAIGMIASAEGTMRPKGDIFLKKAVVSLRALTMTRPYISLGVLSSETM